MTTRLKLAWHVFRGRPLTYRMRLSAPFIVENGGADRCKILENTIVNAGGVGVEVPR